MLRGCLCSSGPGTNPGHTKSNILHCEMRFKHLGDKNLSKVLWSVSVSECVCVLYVYLRWGGRDIVFCYVRRVESPPPPQVYVNYSLGMWRSRMRMGGLSET